MRLAIFGWILVAVLSVGLLAFGDRIIDVIGPVVDHLDQIWVAAPEKPIDNRKPSELLAPDADQTSPGLTQLAGMAR